MFVRPEYAKLAGNIRTLGGPRQAQGEYRLASLPRHNQRSPALCGCKKHGMDLYGDHTSTCTADSGATKAHDWAVGVLGPLFRTAGHVVRTQHGATASAGQRRGDVEVRNYLRDAAGSRSLIFDLSITHDRIGSSCHVQQNGSLSHKQDKRHFQGEAWHHCRLS